jgi:CBS domain-containing protein
VEGLDGKNVGDVMVRHPKVYLAAATVDDARALFGDDHVHMVLLVDDGRLRGTLTRSDVSVDLDGRVPASMIATLAGRTIAPEVDAETARLAMVAAGSRRLAVIDEDGNLLGLLCLKSHSRGFCADSDVAARAAEQNLRRHACVLW